MSERDNALSPDLQRLIDEGEALKARLRELIGDDTKTPGNLRVDVQRWFNVVHRRIAHLVIPDPVFYLNRRLRIEDVLQRLDKIRLEGHHEQALHSAEVAFDDVLDAIRSVPAPVEWPVPTGTLVSPGGQGSFIRDTAFIIMWMDPTKPELVDVVNTYKDSFALFGIQAVRADDIEHSDRITDVVLNAIQTAEYIVHLRLLSDISRKLW